MSKVVRDAERRLHLARMRLSSASAEQRAECEAAIEEAKRLLAVAHRRVAGDELLEREKGEIDVKHRARP